MTSKQYLALRNRLQSIACTIDTNTKEYANLNRRISIITDKTFNKILEENRKHI